MSDQVQLPNIQDMFGMIENIKEVELKLESVKLKIDQEISDITLSFQKPENYAENGKPQSMAFLEKTHLKTGVATNEFKLYKLREAENRLKAELNEAKMIFQLNRDIMSVWQTQEANKRSYSMGSNNG